jgi:16S rRNA (guanine966-N2)-methyltransferase
MRITGGFLAGRRVECPPGVIRPAMDRMRESVFAVLGSLDGCSFLDLFSGSGAVALEAISRGAVAVTLVERDRRKRAVLLRNISIANPPPNVVIAPVERYIARTTECFDVVFADPPFDYPYKEDLIRRIARAASGGTLLAGGGRVVIHYPSTEKLPSASGRLR